MPTNPHYEVVRAKVIATCPELMELSFGTKLHRHNKRFGDYSIYYVLTYAGQGRPEGQIWISSIPFGSMTLDMSKDEIKNGGEFEIIGHPIRLSHVLRTAGKQSDTGENDCFMDINMNGLMELRVGNTAGTLAYWDLTKDDLASQSPETWEALDKMLSV